MEIDLVPSAEKQAFLAHIIDDPADDLRRLVFADWLEENGKGRRAAYIRARCALDGKRPEFGTYADAVEQLAACRYQPPSAADGVKAWRLFLKVSTSTSANHSCR